MISPEFRNCTPVDLIKETESFVKKHHGDELWTALSPGMIELANLRNELKNVSMYKCDVEQLHKFKDIFAKSYNHSILLNKYFSLGPGDRQLNVKFGWTDSFSKDHVQSH
jgi:hypothetical protein